MVTIIAYLLIGIMIGILNTDSATISQIICPQRLLGRVSGIINSISVITMPIGILIVSIIIQLSNIKRAFLTAGLFILAIGIISLIMKNNELKFIPRKLVNNK